MACCFSEAYYRNELEFVLDTGVDKVREVSREVATRRLCSVTHHVL